MDKKMTIAILGLGSRGFDVYAKHIPDFSDKMELTAVADLRTDRVEEAKKLYGLKAENCFYSAEDILAQEQLADVYLYAGSRSRKACDGSA